MALLTPEEIKTTLGQTSGWKKRGKTILRTIEFKNFMVAVKFVSRVARIAEKEGHHPDIDIRWNKVTLTLSTHSEGGLTARDFQLAEKINRLVRPSRS